jgi:hypothetical protein
MTDQAPGRRSDDLEPTSWSSIRCGDAVVTFGKPFYGKRKIIANAPLSANNFDALIQALTDARHAYLGETQRDEP